MSLNRRTLISSASAAALLLSMDSVWAAQPVVEIIAFAHPPVQSALKPLREWLTSQGKHARVIEIDMETPAGEKRAAAVGVCAVHGTNPAGCKSRCQACRAEG
ncbi:hypothetical protein [Rhodoferax sp.]|uniref:hypothetical protein n=1 Tax=Rhodoferax sp. TaxID=50421 RepID=UPI00284CC696|nr:hypothetical protein [Rhodoferax sp.]MDR3367657.1 hypothetical protein [Rhodoferax sp.]